MSTQFFYEVVHLRAMSCRKYVLDLMTFENNVHYLAVTYIKYHVTLIKLFPQSKEFNLQSLFIFCWNYICVKFDVICKLHYLYFHSRSLTTSYFYELFFSTSIKIIIFFLCWYLKYYGLTRNNQYTFLGLI